MGVDYAQGFGIVKPSPLADIDPGSAGLDGPGGLGQSSSLH
jgi:hypothetical protein